jgi:2-polyprenyl-3-methyl-5-hydroxy-6-metoxy-1,4-benzoquinol methylase
MKSSAINYNDPRQDVHIERLHGVNLFRYEAAEKLMPTESTGLKILELGGGIAELTKRMLKKGFDVTFVDLSDKNLEKARKLGVTALSLDLNEGLKEFDNGIFDGVIILEVIEHIVAAEFLLSEISRVLKKGGFIILSTPNFNFFINRIRILTGKLSFDEGYHYRFFNTKVLRKRLEDACFKLTTTYNTCPAFGYNILANRLFKKPRRHVKVPMFLSSLFAHTLIYKGIKI